MFQLSQNSQRLLLVLLAGMTSLFWGILTAPGLAQWNSGTYRPPRNICTPTRTISAGTRATDECRPTQGAGTRGNRCPVAETSPSLIAVVPNDTFGVTLKSHPTFLFYLPVIAEGITPPSVEFIIWDLDDWDSGDDEIYKTRFNTDSQGGIASISLPEHSGFKGLELNKVYIWAVVVTCPGNGLGSLLTEGFIQRVTTPPELAPSVLQGMSAIEQAELLSSAGIWYDTVALLAELQRNQPLPQWTNILEAVDLLDLVNQPLIDGRSSATPNPTTPNP
jgi:hypothetical protein